MRLFTLFSAISLLALIACQEEITLDLPNENPKLVIEGNLTYWEFAPERNHARVRLTTTGNYYDANASVPVSDAQVIIRDQANEQDYVLIEQEDSAGFYFTDEIPIDSGNTYTLTVNYQEQVYEGRGTVLPVAEVDSFSYRFLEDLFFLDDGYYFFFSGRTPKERGTNYYRFLVYEDDSLYNAREDLLIQSDEFLTEQIDTLQLANYAFELGDSVRIEMFSLNPGQYDYYTQLQELLFNDGGLFSGPPRNPTSTIRNLTNPQELPLGFFQVSSAISGGSTVK
ncbi:DUF4249 family protein [Tunicatimonas pelagia]|uniref:DUF4249 family protein n=1 Tax=Tunicatimonas pelagia TaxID=931531 RepID=UPI0026664CC4|nr:DUF4249 family protein [Tunicatimonas pelagia]WKN41923.1 DUF4249 family protein [Tunicatimonas pelagia]